MGWCILGARPVGSNRAGAARIDRTVAAGNRDG